MLALWRCKELAFQERASLSAWDILNSMYIGEMLWMGGGRTDGRQNFWYWPNIASSVFHGS